MAEPFKPLIWSPMDVLDPYVKGFRERWDAGNLNTSDIPMAMGTSLTNLLVGEPLQAGLNLARKTTSGRGPTVSDIIPTMTEALELATPGVAMSALKKPVGDEIFGIGAWHGSGAEFPAERLVETAEGPGYITGEVDQLPDVLPQVSVTQDLPYGRFRDDKLLSGMGANVFGRGHYFAEHKPTAVQYRDTQAEKNPFVNDVPLYKVSNNAILQDQLADVFTDYSHYGTPLDEAVPKFQKKVGDQFDALVDRVYKFRDAAEASPAKHLDDVFMSQWNRAEERLQDMEEAHQYMQMLKPEHLSVKQGGGLYEVDIKGDPTDDFVNVQRQFKEQSPAILDKMEAKGLLDTSDPDNFFAAPMQSFNFENPDVTQSFRDAGIKGLKTLDHMLLPTLNEPDITPRQLYNYIVFSGDDVDILNRYAVTGLPGAGGLLGEENNQTPGNGLLNY